MLTGLAGGFLFQALTALDDICLVVGIFSLPACIIVADRTVAAFAASLKDAVDLDSIRDDLAGAVHQALEPAHLSVWISRRG